MTALLRSDAIQLRTTRTGWALGLAAVLLPTVITILILSFGEVHDVRELLSGWGGGTLFIMILATVAATGNFRHRVAVTERLISPHPGKMLTSKIIIFGLAGVSLTLLTDVVGIGLSQFFPDSSSITFSGWETAVLTDVAAGGLGAIFGLSIAYLIRSQIGAMITLMAYLFILEPVLGVLREKFDISALGFTPGQGISDMLSSGDLHSPGVGALILGVWIAVILAAGALLDKKRDLG